MDETQSDFFYVAHESQMWHEPVQISIEPDELADAPDFPFLPEEYDSVESGSVTASSPLKFGDAIMAFDWSNSPSPDTEALMCDSPGIDVPLEDPVDTVMEDEANLLENKEPGNLFSAPLPMHQFLGEVTVLPPQSFFDGLQNKAVVGVRHFAPSEVISSVEMPDLRAWRRFHLMSLKSETTRCVPLWMQFVSTLLKTKELKTFELWVAHRAVCASDPTEDFSFHQKRKRLIEMWQEYIDRLGKMMSSKWDPADSKACLLRELLTRMGFRGRASYRNDVARLLAIGAIMWGNAYAQNILSDPQPLEIFLWVTACTVTVKQHCDTSRNLNSDTLNVWDKSNEMGLESVPECGFSYSTSAGNLEVWHYPGFFMPPRSVCSIREIKLLQATALSIPRTEKVPLESCSAIGPACFIGCGMRTNTPIQQAIVPIFADMDTGDFVAWPNCLKARLAYCSGCKSCVINRSTPFVPKNIICNDPTNYSICEAMCLLSNVIYGISSFYSVLGFGDEVPPLWIHSPMGMERMPSILVVPRDRQLTESRFCECRFRFMFWEHIKLAKRTFTVWSLIGMTTHRIDK